MFTSKPVYVCLCVCKYAFIYRGEIKKKKDSKSPSETDLIQIFAFLY